MLIIDDKNSYTHKKKVNPLDTNIHAAHVTHFACYADAGFVSPELCSERLCDLGHNDLLVESHM